jgi:hypothetical protein
MALRIVNDARSVFLEDVASVSRCVGWGVHCIVVSRRCVYKYERGGVRCSDTAYSVGWGFEMQCTPRVSAMYVTSFSL